MAAAGDRPWVSLRRRSPLVFMHGVWFVLGGGLWFFWSWMGLIVIAVGVLSLYVVARAVLKTEPNMAGRLTALRDDLVALEAAAEHPGASPKNDQRLGDLARRFRIVERHAPGERRPDAG